jgi:hypothetical protein
VHIPKTGGSSIAFQIYGKRSGHYSASSIREGLGEHEFYSYFSFAVVRNPYQRALSGYRYIKNRGGSDGGVFMKPEYSSNAFLSFDSFVKDWLIHQDPNEIDILFRPQHKFVCDINGGIIVDWIGKIENFEDIKIKVFRELGVAIKNKFRNVTLKKNDIELSTEIKLLLFRYYNRDFEIFKYPF